MNGRRERTYSKHDICTRKNKNQKRIQIIGYAMSLSFSTTSSGKSDIISICEAAETDKTSTTLLNYRFILIIHQSDVE